MSTHEFADRLRAIASAIALLTLASAGVSAQERDFDTVASDYVSEGLRNNLALQGETLEVERATHILAAARANFMPQLSLEARYTRAEGGREIDIPLGTALNPVYRSLNDMLIAQGQSAQFPEVADQSIPFLRTHEQDTRFVVRQPVYAPVLAAAVRAQRALLSASDYRRMAIARTLRRDITTAYVQWLRSSSSMQIVAASEELLRENLRVNDSLYSNGKITEDQVLRAKAELLAVEQQKRDVANLATQARSYFNFLLNRDLLADIEVTTPPTLASQSDAALEYLWSQALNRRPEVAQVEQLRKAREAQVTLARKQRWPTLSLGLDGGTQGEEYRFGSGYNFATASLLFSWKLFDGGGDAARVREARAAEKQLVLQQEEVAQQIRLEVQQSLDRLQTARDSLTTASARADAARAGFRIASRKRDEGVISQVEFIDARSAMTNAELNHNVTQFEVLARRADLQYATSAGDLPLEPGS